MGIYLKNLKEFHCSGNQIKTIENLPASLKYFYCWDNQIKTIENLPASLEMFYCSGNPVEYVDNVRYDRINFTFKGYQAIKRIQKRIKIRHKRKQVILDVQDEIEDWIWKPICKDGLHGVAVTLGGYALAKQPSLRELKLN